MLRSRVPGERAHRISSGAFPVIRRVKSASSGKPIACGREDPGPGCPGHFSGRNIGASRTLRLVSGPFRLRFTHPGHGNPSWARHDSRRWHWPLREVRDGIFPAAAPCARCHGERFEPDRVHEAVVEVGIRPSGTCSGRPLAAARIASVRTSDGQLITVGLPYQSGPWRGHRAVRAGHRAVRRCEEMICLYPAFFRAAAASRHAARGVGHRHVDHLAVDGGRGAALRHRLVERLQHAARNSRARAALGA